MGQGVVTCSFGGMGSSKSHGTQTAKTAQTKNKQKNGKLLMLWVVSFFWAVVNVKLLGKNVFRLHVEIGSCWKWERQEK